MGTRLCHRAATRTVGTPLFEGDTMYPKSVSDYYEWHGELLHNAPLLLDDFILGYLHGDDEDMLNFRRAKWDVTAVAQLAPLFEDIIEPLPEAESLSHVEIGIRRASIVAALGFERSVILASSAATRQHLTEVAAAIADTAEMPEDYLRGLYLPVSSFQWDW